MKRLLRIGLAQVKCHAYLLLWGMWRGECELIIYHTTGRRGIQSISTVRACSDFTPVRTFYSESPRRPIL